MFLTVASSFVNAAMSSLWLSTFLFNRSSNEVTCASWSATVTSDVGGFTAVGAGGDGMGDVTSGAFRGWGNGGLGISGVLSATLVDSSGAVGLVILSSEGTRTGAGRSFAGLTGAAAGSGAGMGGIAVVVLVGTGPVAATPTGAADAEGINGVLGGVVEVG